jgi:hypothetical protein
VSDKNDGIGCAPWKGGAFQWVQVPLVEEGLTRSGDPNRKQKAIYRLTEKAIALVPVFAQIGAWGQSLAAGD